MHSGERGNVIMRYSVVAAILNDTLTRFLDDVDDDALLANVLKVSFSRFKLLYTHTHSHTITSLQNGGFYFTCMAAIFKYYIMLFLFIFEFTL